MVQDWLNGCKVREWITSKWALWVGERPCQELDDVHERAGWEFGQLYACCSSVPQRYSLGFTRYILTNAFCILVIGSRAWPFLLSPVPPPPPPPPAFFSFFFFLVCAWPSLRVSRARARACVRDYSVACVPRARRASARRVCVWVCVCVCVCVCL